MKTIRTLLWVGLLALGVTVLATRAAEAHKFGFPFVGEFALQASAVCPAGWLPTDGRELLIRHHVELFQVIGTTYGGDGQTTFVLPYYMPANLTGCIATHGVFPQP
jgi:hypothetical protein